MKTTASLILPIVLGLFVAVPRLAASKDAVVTAVFSSVSNGYERQKSPDGSYKREYYALANGQYVPGLESDPSIDKVSFPTIAGLVAEHLAKQNYFLARDAKSADILLLISWGTTAPFSDAVSRNSLDHALTALSAAQLGGHSRLSVVNPSAGAATDRTAAPGAGDDLENAMIEIQSFNDMRRKADEWNARLLGYSKEINDRDNPSRYGGAGSYFDDLMSDIEESRYYVIVSAYDFHAATQGGKRKLLWATRVSIRAQGNRFDEGLKTMLANAGAHFGEETHSLIRQYHSGGTVRMDDLKYMSVKPESTDSAKPAEKK